jgi:hypothetical protein
MKKLLIAILTTAGLLLGMSSCHKYCQCKYYEAGEVVLEDELEDITGIYKNCGEYQYYLHQADPDYDDENKTGWYCY